MWTRSARAIVSVMAEWKLLQTRHLRVRFAGEDDEEALTRLAHLDRRRPPRGPVLIAEVRGNVVAALSLDDRQAVCDPRKPGVGELVLMLIEHAREIRRADALPRQLMPMVWPRWADDELEAAL